MNSIAMDNKLHAKVIDCLKKEHASDHGYHITARQVMIVIENHLYKKSYVHKELKDAFAEWNENSDQFPSNRLLSAINRVIRRNPSEEDVMKMMIRKHGKICGTCKVFKTCRHTEGWRVRQSCSRESGVKWVSPFSKATK